MRTINLGSDATEQTFGAQWCRHFYQYLYTYPLVLNTFHSDSGYFESTL